jgi:hypothetical protein
MADRDSKGRGVRGERAGRAKLTPDIVSAIRGAYTGTHGQIAAFARTYGVSGRSVLAVVRRESWSHCG